MFKIFFSKYLMGKLGRDPEFFKEVKVSVGDFIFNKTAKHLASVEAQNNLMLRYNLTGSFGEMLPHYLQPENFAKIKSNLHKLHLVQGYAEEGILNFGKFDCMNLSNIFEYMNAELFAETAGKLFAAVKQGGRLVYWNLMVPRRISQIFPEQLEHLQALSESLAQHDKGFFYNQFIIDQVR